MKHAPVVGIGIMMTLVLAGSGMTAQSKSKTKLNPPAKASNGDVKAGAKAFAKVFSSDCKNCHKFKSEGGSLGPDLSHVGKRMSASKIKAILKNPRSVNPKSIMPPLKDTDKALTDIAAFLASRK